MNQEWSNKNKEIQTLLNKESTYKEGISKLIEFRGELFHLVQQLATNLPEKALSEMPYPNVDGFHNKTIAYSLWHIFRIEDIVAHELIAQDTQILFIKDNQERINTNIITTGNELVKKEIVDFSKKLNTSALLDYCHQVMLSTNQLLLSLSYSDLKKTFGLEDKNRLIETHCISTDEHAFWLIDYWCGKTVKELIKMPFSRHWIMHIEAICRIKNRLCQIAKKTCDPVAYCGFSCNHCFLSEWCGGCRSEYNICSFATCCSDKQCPNASCCKQKGIDGCYECQEIIDCHKGFYAPESDGAIAAKSQAIYIQKHGKKEFIQLQNRLHEKYSFKKTQEILSSDLSESVQFLEEN